MTEINEQTLTEIHHCIRQCMLSPDDFSVVLADVEEGQRVIEIRYLPKDISRQYQQGPGSSFPVDFCFDVASGLFGTG